MKTPQSAVELNTFWEQLAKVNADVQRKVNELNYEIKKTDEQPHVMRALNNLINAAQSLNDIVPDPNTPQ